MIAFVKRRWVLVSYALVVVACSMISWGRRSSTAQVWQEVGLKNGNLFYEEQHSTRYAFEEAVSVWEYVHAPSFGALPNWDGVGDTTVSVPIWLLLSALIGWIVIRELRWREKRGKETDENDSHTGGGGSRL
jgi:hypothetical protein